MSWRAVGYVRLLEVLGDSGKSRHAAWARELNKKKIIHFHCTTKPGQNTSRFPISVWVSTQTSNGLQRLINICDASQNHFRRIITWPIAAATFVKNLSGIERVVDFIEYLSEYLLRHLIASSDKSMGCIAESLYGDDMGANRYLCAKFEPNQKGSSFFRISDWISDQTSNRL